MTNTPAFPRLARRASRRPISGSMFLCEPLVNRRRGFPSSHKPVIEAGFPRSHRLLNGEDFGKVFKQASKSSDALFTILWRPNGTGIARLGMAISKKNVRRAVDRNLVKRLTRESFRLHQGALAGTDLVVLGRRGLPPVRRSQIRSSLEQHWGRIIRQLERIRDPGSQLP